MSSGPDDPKGPPPASEGGTVGEHPQFTQTFVVAPSLPDDQTFNTIRPGLLTVACWRLDDIRFDFDSSFVLPEAATELTRLAELREQWPKNPISLFGHADPVGDDAYNKKLSGRRARAVYGILTRNTDIWEQLHKEPAGGDVWGLKSAQHILTAFGLYAGDINGQNNKATQDALRIFSDGAGAPADGKDSKGTRQKLYEQYFDFLSKSAEGNPFKLAKEEFLGKGVDPDGKGGDYQGCSEFNPVLLLEKNVKRTKEERNKANAPSRRVVAFFFVEGLEVDPAKWPCPTWKEGTTKCRARFYSDSDRRLAQVDDLLREYKKTRDTMACRFYDRFARRSPCEAGFKEWVLRIFVTKGPPPPKDSAASDGPTSGAGPGGSSGGTSTAEPGDQAADNETVSPFKDKIPLVGAEYVVSGAGGPEVRGRTDPNGFIRVRVSDDTPTMTLKVAGQVITLNGGALPELDDPSLGDTVAVVERLFNMAYGPGERAAFDPVALKDAVKKFRADFELPDGDAVDDAFKEKLREIHGS